MRTIKRRRSFSEDFSLKKKRGSFREVLNLSANFYLATTLILLPNKYWVHITRVSFIGENGCHSVRAWPPFSPINISKKRGSLSERAFWKWGSLGESKMWKIKRGSFSDRRFEIGGQCGRTNPSHIFRECPPPPPPGIVLWLLLMNSVNLVIVVAPFVTLTDISIVSVSSCIQLS